MDSVPHPESICADVALEMASPAVTEASVLGAIGASEQGDAWSASVGGGTELTFGTPLWRGFPSGPYGERLDLAELRAGPWFAVFTRAHGVVVEGGPKLHLGAVYHASWGTFPTCLPHTPGMTTNPRRAPSVLQLTSCTFDLDHLCLPP